MANANAELARVEVLLSWFLRNFQLDVAEDLLIKRISDENLTRVVHVVGKTQVRPLNELRLLDVALGLDVYHEAGASSNLALHGDGTAHLFNNLFANSQSKMPGSHLVSCSHLSKLAEVNEHFLDIGLRYPDALVSNDQLHI